MRNLTCAVFAAILAIGGTAFAGTDAWQACSSAFEQGTNRSTDAQRKLDADGTRSLCYHTDGTADSLMLTFACRETDVLVYDLSGNHDFTLDWMACPNPTASSTSCEAVNGSTSLTGDATTPAFEIQGHGQNYGFVDNIVNGNTRQIVVEARCGD